MCKIYSPVGKWAKQQITTTTTKSSADAEIAQYASRWMPPKCKLDMFPCPASQDTTNNISRLQHVGSLDSRY